MDDRENRNNRAKAIVARAASEFIQLESNRQSLITVTNVIINDNFQKATIFVTVFPEHKEEAVMDFLRRQRRYFKEFVKKSTRLNRVPQFDFAIDLGEKSRQRIDEII